MLVKSVKDRVGLFFNSFMGTNQSFYAYANIALKKLILDAKPLALTKRLSDGVKPFLILDDEFCIVEPETLRDDEQEFVLDDSLEDALSLYICFLLSNYDQRFLLPYQMELNRYRELKYDAFNKSNRRKYQQVWL